MSLALTGPPDLADVVPVPHGRTARRLAWPHLPTSVRATVERRLGSEVVLAVSQGSGFTPGFASVLTGADGSTVFVKAASRKAQPQFAAAYAEEARTLAILPVDRLPVPRLLWTEEEESWFVLGFEAVAGRNPRRPWRAEELTRCLEALSVVDAVLEEPPEGLRLRPLQEDLPTLLTGWGSMRAARPDWPHLDEVEELAQSFGSLPDAGHVVHADARDDNFLLTDDGRTLLCDWNWPGTAPRWLDAVDLLVSARADGLDADHLLRSHPLTVDAVPDHVDAWLAALCGYMVEADTRPVPATSPHLGTHRRWWAAATWSWLAARRGWQAQR
jgi:hypothetical protein